MQAMTHKKQFHSLLKETVIISTESIFNAKVFLYFFAEPIKFPVGFKLFLKYVLYKIHCCSKLFALVCFYSWNAKCVRAWQFSHGFPNRTNALSFYRSQNFLRQTKNLFTYCGCHKHFAPDQKFIYILWQSQTFCARQKDDLHSVKLVFVPALNAVKFFG